MIHANRHLYAQLHGYDVFFFTEQDPLVRGGEGAAGALRAQLRAVLCAQRPPPATRREGECRRGTLPHASMGVFALLK